ncbi:oligosaccharide flippase family protein [Clostridium estertheticum]|uniref:oligosaccharide flippase family protein n=1 Tax=Clostridium estertheticum TaxID=238834 RepID=UPI001C0C8551|nr:oligosaccharide flippase family protein [Clostridium estertheticum]MBU3172989.1 oligosaccharide flippase family protein [Clostridium estertheticum]MBU3183950.1 oligosaccharide flippase family protein [Clostridium estertheticum]
MEKNMKFTKTINNIIYAFTAQGISFVLSVMMSLVVPKILGVQEFSYWQLFVFYTSYVGFFLFGLNDGIYLRIGGMEYESLDSKSVASQFWIAFLFQCILAGVLISYSLLFINDWNRSFVFITTAIYLPLNNASGFIGYIFQAVNKTKIYSLSVIIDRLCFIVVVIILLILKCDSFIWFIVLNLIGKLFALMYCIWKGRSIIFVRIESIKKTLKEILINVSVGVNLMFSNIASLLILGIGRFIVDGKWGIGAFGRFSFSLTLATFLLSFISQASMVLFPALRQTNETQQMKFYWISRNLLGVVLAGFLLAYMPLNYILNLWLPAYKESLQYLIILLPLCTYDGKMSMICTTYFKVLRKEKLLLKINLISLTLSVILTLVASYMINNIYAVAISMLLAVAFRSIISDIYLSKIMGGSVLKNIVYESLLVAIFMVCTWFINPVGGFIIYLVSYGTYLIISRKKLISIVCSAKKYLKA